MIIFIVYLKKKIAVMSVVNEIVWVWEIYKKWW